MRKFKNRDRPRRMSWLDGLITCIAILAIFGVVGALGGFGSLFKDKDKTPGISTGDVDKPSVEDPDVPEEDEPTVPEEPDPEPEPEPDPEPVVGRGSGKYASASGVLTYDYVGDTTETGYDLGFAKQMQIREGNESRVTIVDGDACWEISRNNVLESAVNNMHFTPVDQYGSKYVFETDILWEGCTLELNNGSYGWIGKFELKDSNENVLNVFMHSDDSGDLYLGNLALSITYMTIPKNEWCTLRFEVIGDTLYFYLNGEEVHYESVYNMWPDYQPLSGSFTQVMLENRCYTKDLFYKIDNTYVSAIN